MHSSPEGDGVYFDYVANHPRIYGNVAYRLGPADPEKKARRGCGFLIKNGTNNRAGMPPRTELVTFERRFTVQRRKYICAWPPAPVPALTC
jgi:hypothetical protein